MVPLKVDLGSGFGVAGFGVDGRGVVVARVGCVDGVCVVTVRVVTGVGAVLTAELTFVLVMLEFETSLFAVLPVSVFVKACSGVVPGVGVAEISGVGVAVLATGGAAG